MPITAIAEVFLGHGVLRVLGAPGQLLVLAGPEHGRTIPLPDIRGGLGFRANTGKFQNVRLSGHRMNILQLLGKLRLSKWLGKPWEF